MSMTLHQRLPRANIKRPCRLHQQPAPPPAPHPLDASSGGQSLDIQFSEDIALLLGTGLIQLTNLTTGQDVPQVIIPAVAYDPATQIVHYFYISRDLPP